MTTIHLSPIPAPDYSKGVFRKGKVHVPHEKLKVRVAHDFLESQRAKGILAECQQLEFKRTHISEGGKVYRSSTGVAILHNPSDAPVSVATLLENKVSTPAPTHIAKLFRRVSRVFRKKPVAVLVNQFVAGVDGLQDDCYGVFEMGRSFPVSPIYTVGGTRVLKVSNERGDTFSEIPLRNNQITSISKNVDYIVLPPNTAWSRLLGSSCATTSYTFEFLF